MHNISELDGKYEMIDIINGYNVYIPSVYYTPLSYLKRNCPIWIQVNNEGLCHVIILSKNNQEENAKEIEDYIIENLQPINHHIFCRSVQNSDYHPLSCVAIDNNGRIYAEILIKDNGSSVIIESVNSDNDEVLLKLREYLLSENNIQKYPALVLEFNLNKIPLRIIDLLGGIYIESRETYILQLV